MATRPWPTEKSVRIALEGTTAKSVNWANIFWAQTTATSDPTSTQCASLAGSVFAFFGTTLWDLLGNDALLTRCVVNYYGAQPTQIVGEHAGSTAGGSSNATEVDSLSACISWGIGATWRGGKPRTYLAALPTEAFNDSNSLDSTFIGDVESRAASFMADVNGISTSPFSTVSLGCMSFFSGNAPRASAAFFPYSSATVHPRIDSMRRRLGRETT